jgi:hypothetical protein
MRFLPNSRNLGVGSVDKFLSRCICEFAFNTRRGEITHFCPAHNRIQMTVAHNQTWINAFGVSAKCE